MGILISNITALIRSGGVYEAKNCSVYIDGNRIAAIGSIPPEASVDKTIDGTGKLLIPGLVNAHTHAYMTVFRNCADDLPFSDWLFGRILPLEDRIGSEDSYWATMLACMEMISTGTTSYLDMYIYPDSAPRAVIDSGMRAVISRGLVGSLEDTAGGERRINEALHDMKAGAECDRVSYMLAPHAPYSSDEYYLRRVAELAGELGVGIHTHISEGRTENAEIIEKYGVSPVALFKRCGLLGSKTVAAHCVWLSDEDIEILRETGTSVATNPISNLKLANGVAPVPKLLRAGVNVAVGTDGCASNNSLNLFRDIGVLATIHKGITGNPTAVTAADCLKIATVNGAAALGLGNVGDIEVGYLADLTILDLDRPNMVPNTNPLSAVSYSANGSEVDTVIVDGKVLYEHGEFTTIDAQRVKYEIKKICEKIGVN